jgi:hypothetical protein
MNFIIYMLHCMIALCCLPCLSIIFLLTLSLHTIPNSSLLKLTIYPRYSKLPGRYFCGDNQDIPCSGGLGWNAQEPFPCLYNSIRAAFQIHIFSISRSTSVQFCFLHGNIIGKLLNLFSEKHYYIIIGDHHRFYNSVWKAYGVEKFGHNT